MADKGDAHELGDLLLVRWLDAHNYPAQWTDLDDLDTYTCEVRSVGWQVHKDDQQLIMSADVAVDNDDELQLNTVFAIPVGCIVEITVLRRADG